ncbi:hypothetical protein SAMN03080601_02559 [Alkalitalea saponilacus]|uniref:Uncharacterized protein n=1 Tax=Alkalitalea saponilacus TaxID=889453 RepID=A0A1T5HNU7_9BACT|nr:hypothetical protein SAMN03080601_02559 [Alkalitalea saponilacus]
MRHYLHVQQNNTNFYEKIFSHSINNIPYSVYSYNCSWDFSLQKSTHNKLRDTVYCRIPNLLYSW